MSGIGMAAAGGKSGSASGPLVVSVPWAVSSGGGGGNATVNVSGASGNTKDIPDGNGNNTLYFSFSVGGGTPPYSTTYPTITSNPSGKLSLYGVGGTGEAIVWSGFTVGESETIVVRGSATDSASGSASDSRTVTIRRQS